eukprot:scaffold148801_cov35-Prasinocladus_malaysianus.AAC.1
MGSQAVDGDYRSSPLNCWLSHHTRDISSWSGPRWERFERAGSAQPHRTAQSGTVTCTVG